VDQLYWLLVVVLLLLGVVVFALFTVGQRLDAILRQLLLLQRKADLALTHLGIQPPPEHSPLSERVRELAGAEDPRHQALPRGDRRRPGGGQGRRREVDAREGPLSDPLE